MARATKAVEDVGRGPALPAAATTTFDAFIIENTLDPTGEPDGIWYRTNGNWILGGSTGTAGVATGTTLPPAATAVDPVFIIENSADPVGEPDGLWFVYLGNWVQSAAA